jgi:hypothetical protein
MRYLRSSRRFERNLDGQVRIQGVRDPLPGPAVFTQCDFANTISNTIRRVVAILWSRTDHQSMWNQNSQSFPSSCRV